MCSHGSAPAFHLASFFGTASKRHMRIGLFFPPPQSAPVRQGVANGAQGVLQHTAPATTDRGVCPSEWVSTLPSECE